MAEIEVNPEELNAVLGKERVNKSGTSTTGDQAFDELLNDNNRKGARVTDNANSNAKIIKDTANKLSENEREAARKLAALQADNNASTKNVAALLNTKSDTPTTPVVPTSPAPQAPVTPVVPQTPTQPNIPQQPTLPTQYNPQTPFLTQPGAQYNPQQVYMPAPTAPSVDDDTISLTPEQFKRLTEAIKAIQKKKQESDSDDDYEGSLPQYKGAKTAYERGVLDAVKEVQDADIRYVWGGGNDDGITTGQNGPDAGANDGDGRTGFDCSGFAQYVEHRASGGEFSVPKPSGNQYALSVAVPSLAEARPGDLVFPPGENGANHVQVYIGDGQIAEMYTSGQPLRISNYTQGYEIRRPEVALDSH